MVISNWISYLYEVEACYMEVIYYHSTILGCAPVKKYLAANFNPKKEDDQRKIADIRARIEYARERNGQPDGNIIKPIHDFGVIEIRVRKNEDRLIRIMYFCCEDRLVLLAMFDKPDHYNTHKVRKDIIREYKLSEEAKNDCIKNKKYEEYK